MTFSIAILLGLLTLSARKLVATPIVAPNDAHNLNTRASYPLTGGFIAGDVFHDKYGTDAWCCSGSSCQVNFGQSADGQYFQACFTPGDQLFSQDDVDVSNCLTNLHYLQTSTCIDVAGSSCNSYTGRIQQMSIFDGNLSPTGGQGKGQQLTALDSATIQAGIDSFLGQQMRTDSGVSGPTVYVVAADPHSRAGGVGIINYIGSDDC